MLLTKAIMIQRSIIQALLTGVTLVQPLLKQIPAAIPAL